MIDWRLLKLETHNAFMNMAIDEAIQRARVEGLVPNTIRFYRWKPSAVSIGRFQDIENEVQIANCGRYGVEIVRRTTGGGAVYHDARGEITYSLVFDKKAFQTEDIIIIYAMVYSGLAEALRLVGINADFNEGNAKTCPNLTVKGKKISGSAQSHKNGVVLQHGTLLIDVDLPKMFTLLRVPWANTCIEVVDVAKRRITSVNEQLGREVSIEEANDALVQGFSKALNAELCRGELTVFEQSLAKALCREKYVTEDWNRCGRTPREN